MAVVEATQLTRVYGSERGGAAHRALAGVNVTVEQGEFVGIMGPSGSGKTTLLQLLGTIDVPTSGEIRIGGRRLAELKGDDLAQFRRQKLGFIFQDFNLLDSLTLRENIMVPLVLDRPASGQMGQRIEALASRMGIREVLDRYPYEVSGGQKQRAAAARALIHQPALVLADEPTGSLDSKAARALMEALSSMNEAEGATILLVTHDPVTASYCRRILVIKDGQLFTEIRRGQDRGQFFSQILDVLSAMGGEAYDALYARP